MLVIELVKTSQAITETRSRTKKSALLAACLRAMPPEEAEVGAAYLTGEVPGSALGIGWASVRQALEAPPAAAPQLTVLDIHRQLRAIATLEGRGSQGKRTAALGALFSAATRDEQRFLAGLIHGELRQGALVGTMVEAIAQNANVPKTEVQRALMFCGAVGEVARAALTEGSAGLARFTLTVFRPVLPMLAQPTANIDAALEHIDDPHADFKLDGARVQVHKEGDEVRVYSRRLNDVTAAVPELVAEVRALPVRRIILDGETLSLGPGGKPRPFQETMRRFGSRLNVETLRQELPLSTAYFDCLLLDDDALIDLPTRSRLAAMAIVPPSLRMPGRAVHGGAELEAFWEQALAAGHEGVMVKSLAAPYAAGGRGNQWLKLKPAHTLDLVVLAAEWGSGRRQGWLSNLHLGARDEATGAFVMLGKTFKGLTDAMLTWQTEKLLELEVARDSMTVFVRPELVVEIAFSDVQESSHYPGGMALRFARVKHHRPEKSAAEADTLSAVQKIFREARAS